MISEESFIKLITNAKTRKTINVIKLKKMESFCKYNTVKNIKNKIPSKSFVLFLKKVITIVNNIIKFPNLYTFLSIGCEKLEKEINNVLFFNCLFTSKSFLNKKIIFSHIVNLFVWSNEQICDVIVIATNLIISLLKNNNVVNEKIKQYFRVMNSFTGRCNDDEISNVAVLCFKKICNCENILFSDAKIIAYFLVVFSKNYQELQKICETDNNLVHELLRDNITFYNKILFSFEVNGKHVNLDDMFDKTTYADVKKNIDIDFTKLDSKTDDTTKQCGICYANEQKVKIKKCGHSFCYECSRTVYTSQNPICAFCRNNNVCLVLS